MHFRSLPALIAAATLASACAANPGDLRAETAAPMPAMLPSYADLADLADRAPLVIRAVVKDQAELEPERAPGLAAGLTRLYVEAETQALLTGSAPVGGLLTYLVDLPLDAKGKAPRLKKQDLILFARPVPGHPEAIQLVGPASQLAWSQALEDKLRPILSEMAAADAPPRVTAVRDALAVPGTLVGESETQIFIDTESGEPASITVTRRPGQAPRWGVSWSEIVDQSARAPARDTLAWYRLACSLPERLPSGANLASDPASRRLAAQDYAFVRQQLGPCTRSL